MRQFLLDHVWAVLVVWMLAGIVMGLIHFDVMSDRPIWYGWAALGITLVSMAAGGVIGTLWYGLRS